jgi:hypothetical protein
VCVLTLVLVEVDLDRYEPPIGHNPNLASLNCPYCTNRLRLVGYFEVTHLAPPTGEAALWPGRISLAFPPAVACDGGMSRRTRRLLV